MCVYGTPGYVTCLAVQFSKSLTIPLTISKSLTNPLSQKITMKGGVAHQQCYMYEGGQRYKNEKHQHKVSHSGTA